MASSADKVLFWPSRCVDVSVLRVRLCRPADQGHSTSHQPSPSQGEPFSLCPPDQPMDLGLQITLLIRATRMGRHFYNQADLIKVLEATGLPLEIVPDMGKRSFKEQVS